MPIKRLHSALRAALLGFAGLLLVFAVEGVIHSVHHRDYQFLGMNSAGYASLASVLIVSIAVAKLCERRAWWYGLIAGLSMSVPVIFFVLHAMSPHARTWISLLGRPMLALWAPLACLLLITSIGAESASLWFNSRRLFASFAAIGTAALVVAVTAVGFRVQKFYHAHDEAMRASTALHGVDIPLPTLALTAVDGSPMFASELQGHVAIVDFWGTWCAGCLAEFPSLEAVNKEYSGDSRVRFLLVDPEIEGDTSEKIKRFLSRRPLSIPVALGSSNSYFELSKNLNNDGLPLLLIIDQRGHIRFELNGFESDNKTRHDLHRDIDALLAHR